MRNGIAHLKEIPVFLFSPLSATVWALHAHRYFPTPEGLYLPNFTTWGSWERITSSIYSKKIVQD